MFRRLLFICIPAGLAVSSAWAQEPIGPPSIKIPDPCPSVSAEPCPCPTQTIRLQMPAPRVVIQAAPTVAAPRVQHAPILPCFHRHVAVAGVYVQPAAIYAQPAYVQPAVVYAQPQPMLTYAQPAPLQLTLTPVAPQALAVAVPCPQSKAIADLTENMKEAASLLKVHAQYIKSHEDRLSTVEGQMREARKTLDVWKGVERDPKTGFLKAP